MTDESFRCGYVGLVGRPNAGKSTLLNQILGTKLAITSAKPQTTRDRIVGIHTDDAMQAILVDTPGIHRAWTALNEAMLARTNKVMSDVDVICWLADLTAHARRAEQEGTSILSPEDEEIALSLAGAKQPVIVVANKADVVPKQLILPVIAAFSERLSPAAIIPLSALTGDGLDVLKSEIRRLLPVHPPLFPVDHWAQVTERFLVAEVIREKLFHLTEQEIPYAVHVEVVKFDESAREKDNLVRILADVIVERPSQKGIVIGKGGEMLKRIGTLARKEIQSVLGARVYLELFVKVERDWSKSKKGLRKVGFDAE